MGEDRRLTRIGVFYDGNFFSIVSNYYKFHHARKERISISGLHRFIESEVAAREGVDTSRCNIVDAHYFRGRLSAREADDRGTLYSERVVDDILMREGVVTHYTPLTRSGEKGIDVWFALEAFELAILKRFDVSVLVACDGDYVPLVRKLNTLGTRVMVLGWDFERTSATGEVRTTRTSQALLDEVTYPVTMNTVIDDRARASDPLIRGLFVPAKTEGVLPPPIEGRSSGEEPVVVSSDSRLSGTIQNLNERHFGFITPDSGGANIFFYGGSVEGCAFGDLKTGLPVEYVLGVSSQGPCAVSVRKR